MCGDLLEEALVRITARQADALAAHQNEHTPANLQQLRSDRRDLSLAI
jgi:hypothetical protein